MKSFKEYLAEHNNNHRKAWSKMSKDLRSGIANRDSSGLFKSTMVRMAWFLRNAGHIDSTSDMYESMASELVNNPRSKFYIYG